MESAHARRALCALAAALAVAAVAGCTEAAQTTAAPRPDTSDPAIAACEQTVGAAPWHGALRVRARTTVIDAWDDYFSPSCLIVPPATRVRVTATNRGHLPHTITLPGSGLDVSIDAGQTVFVDLPPTTRPLRFVCTYHVREHMFAAVVPAPS